MGPSRIPRLPVDTNVPQADDEILIHPKFLPKLLPRIDWSKLERQEPIAVRRLLEQQGIVLTNYQQLIGLGITNYIIRRAPSRPAAVPVPSRVPRTAPPTQGPEPIRDLVRAFQAAEEQLARRGQPRAEDIPQKGDQLLIDQSVIGLLIPEFRDRPNSGPFEISRWLTSRGVVLKNYQQLNYLGITNYSIRRTLSPPPAAAAREVAKQNIEVIKLEQKVETLRRESKYQEAVLLAKQALELREKLHGPEHRITASTLERLALLYVDLGKPSEALPLHERALTIRKKVLGAEHVDTANSLNNLGVVYFRMRDYAKAEPLYQRALEIREKLSGPEHVETARILNNLGSLYSETGQLAKAEPLHQRALAIREKALGPEHPDTVASLRDLALDYVRMKDYLNAEPLLERTLKICENTLGLGHPDTGQSLLNLTGFYRKTGNYAKAEALFQRALEIQEKTLGLQHPWTIASLANLALLYRDMGDDAKSEQLYQHCLKTGLALGRDPANTADNLDTLGGIYTNLSDFARAESLLQKALTIRENALGKEHPDVTRSLTNLSRLYGLWKLDPVKVESLLERALKVQEKAYGSESPVMADSLGKLADVYDMNGDYAKAAELYTRSLSIVEKIDGPGHPHTAFRLGEVAKVFDSIGDRPKSDSLLQRALEILENNLGPEHIHMDTARSLDRLASLYRRRGDSAKAATLSEQALQIAEKINRNDWTDIGKRLRSLAEIYSAMGEYARAEPLLERAVKIQEGVLASGFPMAALELVYLANCYREPTKAEPLLQGILIIAQKDLGPEHPVTIMCIDSLASLYRRTEDNFKAERLYQHALKILEKMLGPDHQMTAHCSRDLALLEIDLGKRAEALEMARRVERGRLKTLANILSFTSERQRLAYQAASSNSFYLFATLDNAPETAVALLRHKAVILDSLLEDRLVAQASRNPEQRTVVDQLRLAKQRLPQLLLDVPKDFSPEANERREAEKSKLVNEVEQMEGVLARRVAGLGRARRALGVTVEQVQKAIPRQAVLLELLRYSHYLGTNKWEPRYGAIVLARSGDPKWIPLGSADGIEKNVALCQNAVRGQPMERAVSAAEGDRNPPPAPPRRGDEKGAAIKSSPPGRGAGVGNLLNPGEEQFSTLLQALYQQLWAPIEATLPKGTKTVIISPDGALNFVSYATLITPEDKFLSQKYSIQYVSSGRDLLKEKKRLPIKRVAIYANPDFAGQASASVSSPVGTDGLPKPRESVAQEGRSLRESRSTPSLTKSGAIAGEGVRDAVERVLTESKEEVGRLRYLDQRDLQGLSLPPLPGTAQESALLAEQAKRWHWPANVFVGPEASEAQLAALESTSILHLATHGFFLPDDGEDKKRGLMDGWISGSMDEARGIGGVRPQSENDLLGGSSDFLKPRVALKNPMHRSGLALAGAQATLEAWKRGETPPANNDGIVTADEVGTLKLEGTELVVLSACDTGMGEAKSGEGVLGLRRGFIQAGAQNLLMTLWSVADEETVKLMADFYERFHATGNAPRALAEVQRDWLVKLRRERGLQAAVTLAGPFILSSQGLQ